MSRTADVFISYKAEDRRRIQPLVQALQADGYSVWWDQHIGTGDEWRLTIERQLDAAKCVIVAWSKYSVGPEGHFVRDEAARAQRRSVYLPILLDSVEPPLGFGERQATPLRGWRGNRSDPNYQAIHAAVRRIAGGDGAPAPAVAQRGIDRRTVLVGGVAATAGVAGFGAWALLKRHAAGESGSIAVLPFDNLSGDPGQAYFADGMAGEIRNTLTRIGGLKVAGSTSSAAVREDDAKTAASKLGVANILTGSVRQTQSTIRVTAELLDGQTGLAKWSQNYDRAPGDVISIQTDIAENVARALAIALGAGARKTLAVGETSNFAAQQLVFQAREISYEFTVPAFQRSLRLLDQAVSLDPNYARAYAIKSFVVNNLASAARTQSDLASGRDQAIQLARTALSIAPSLPIARSALAFAYQLNLQLDESLREHKAALSLAGGDPDVMRNYGWTRSNIFGKGDGLRLVDDALTLDPLNWASHLAHVDVLYVARRYVEAVSYTLRLKQESPELFKFPNLLGNALLMLGRAKEAALAFGQDREESTRILGEALLAARTGDRELAFAKLEALRQREGEMASYLYGRIYVQSGDKDGAFAALDRAWDFRDSRLMRLRVDVYMDPLRSDPRYAALVKRIGFPA
jgi:TolB-like protein/Flp pilus assembly protein TadD